MLINNLTLLITSHYEIDSITDHKVLLNNFSGINPLEDYPNELTNIYNNSIIDNKFLG